MPDHYALFNIQRQTAVITGGSGQLGRTMAEGLAEAGVKVAILSLHAGTSAMVAEAIRANGRQAIGIACDVRDRAALERTLEQVTNAFGSVDILLNAAGGINRRLLLQPNGASLTWTCRRWMPSLV